MKKRKIILLIITSLLLICYMKLDRIKLYFANEGYYNILSALHLTKPHYKPLKSFYDIFTQEGFSYKKNNAEVIADTLSKLQNPSIKISRTANIPTITHHVYFTSVDKPIKLNPFYIENLKLTFANLATLEPAQDWQHNIWTNDANLFPDEIKNIKNVRIRNIDEFKEHELYPELVDEIAKGTQAKAYFAEASDLTRLLALQKFGGLYKDIDYEIYDSLALFNLMKRFDFIGGREKLSIKSYYGNSFLAAKANHPVINEALKLLYRNHHQKQSDPIYLKFPSIKFDSIYFNGPPLITIAYFSKNNIHGNSDVILPPWMIYNKAFADFKNHGCAVNKTTTEEVIKNNNNLQESLQTFIGTSKEHMALDGKLTKEEQNIYYNTKYHDSFPIIGADMFCGTWVFDNDFKKIYYWNIPFLRKS